jgi:general secretion pathway protein D
MASNRSSSKSGVPFLKDIPLLGFFFRSTGGSNQRVELIVMMRPTVLKTPEIAAKVATSVKNESPAIRQVEHEEEVQQEKKIRRANKKYGTE